MLSYDYISGNHCPTKACQFIGILKTLKMLHDENYVHGDIRLIKHLRIMMKGNRNTLFNSLEIPYDSGQIETLVHKYKRVVQRRIDYPREHELSLTAVLAELVKEALGFTLLTDNISMCFLWAWRRDDYRKG